MMRIAVIGAGAIGCTLGALLSRAGQDITLIGRPSQVVAIRTGGLQLDGALGTFIIHMPIAEALDFRPDLALLAVKTQDVLAAVQACRPHLMGVPLVTLQNGVRSDDLVASLLPPHQIVSAVVLLVATFLTAGRVTIVLPGSLVIGHPFATTVPIAPMVAQVLNQAIPTHSSANIRGAHWLKLLVNLNNALPAVTNSTMQAVYADPYLRQLAIRLFREGLTVVTRAGIQLESLPEVSVGLIRLLGMLPVRIAARIAAAKIRRTVSSAPVLASTLQSLRRHRPTEIEYLNGEIVGLGAKVGAPTPLNAAVIAMVQHVEQHGQFWKVSAIREAISTGGRNLRAINP